MNGRQQNILNSKEKLFCTISEVAHSTGLSSYYIRQGVKEGWIPHIRCGNKIMVNMRLFLPMLDTLSQDGGESA